MRDLFCSAGKCLIKRIALLNFRLKAASMLSKVAPFRGVRAKGEAGGLALLRFPADLALSGLRLERVSAAAVSGRE
jgi:hypothetical protein